VKVNFQSCGEIESNRKFEVYGGIYMVGKMTKNEKILASLSLAVLVIAIIVKCFIGTTDTGVLVMLSFTGILMWLIILFCAFFPAEWRMTEKQKSKIENHTEYQNKYRKIFIGIDTVIAILFSVLILLSK